jgi:hypothetical protein
LGNSQNKVVIPKRKRINEGAPESPGFQSVGLERKIYGEDSNVTDMRIRRQSWSLVSM